MAMSETLNTLGEKIVGGLAGSATGHTVAFDQLTVTVQAEKIVDVVKFCATSRGFASSISPTSPRSTIRAARSVSTSSITCCRRR